MSIKIGDKVTVRKGAGDFYENCTSKDAEYLIIDRKCTDGAFSWHANDKDGKQIDWCHGHGLTEDDLIPYNRTLDDVAWKDLLMDRNGGCRQVLGRTGDIVFLSYPFVKGEKENSRCGETLSIQELKDFGYTIVDEDKEDDITELTLEEVAQLKGIPVENLRIKEK